MMSSASDVSRRSAMLAILLSGCGAPPTLPDVDYTLLDGSRRQTRELRGRVILVHFWATSCAVCIAEMPQLVSTHQKFRPLGFETLAVAMHYDAPARVSHYASSRQLPFGVAIDNTGAIARAFGDVQATPTSLLVNRQGQVVHRWVGQPDFEALHRQIGALLAAA